jgi:hypothetical protein
MRCGCRICEIRDKFFVRGRRAGVPGAHGRHGSYLADGHCRINVTRSSTTIERRPELEGGVGHFVAAPLQRCFGESSSISASRVCFIIIITVLLFLVSSLRSYSGRNERSGYAKDSVDYSNDMHRFHQPRSLIAHSIAPAQGQPFPSRVLPPIPQVFKVPIGPLGPPP